MKTFLSSYCELKFTEKFYYTSAFFWVLPIFILAFTLPSYPDTPFYLSLNKYLDQFLFGDIFVQSKKFPFSAKVIGNYMGLTIPIANVIYILFYILFDKRHVDSFFKCNLKGIYVVTVYLILMAFFLYNVYVPQGVSSGLSERYDSFRLGYAIIASGIYCILICSPSFFIIHLINKFDIS
ncbi:hypothetical protein [Pasteurella dagmatis]|uniref:Uncharacterized protein n=1 Tax=Pasteurella dagmatis ATCC 43325 TaxID=667128 RepID=C9PPG1_9PAST|nr:hypothetical protein [Pasteurella dagmatis]EEX50659.1 hypothetical protein HMPREF0621_0885 [Pasteurella dagmatis ATCC 43325]SNV81149.1 Uncharacterised protein [Pasteurella dagmatis]